VPTSQAFAPTELLEQLALERMLAKLSTPLPGRPGTSRDRHCPGRDGHLQVGGCPPVRGPNRAGLAELLAGDLSGLDLVALMVDGIRVAEHCCVVALGITIDGTKVLLGLARAPPWWVTCWSACASVGWTSPGRCWS
jgi:hypothetical protein